jgi:hypothetical protein
MPFDPITGPYSTDRTMLIRQERAAIAALNQLRAMGADVHVVHAMPNGMGYIAPDTGRVHGPRDVSEFWTFAQARHAGVPAVTYQLSVRRKLATADQRQRERFVTSWDAAPDTRDVRPDGPAFADIEAGYVRAERSHGKRYADYLRTHDAELRAKGYDPTPWPLSLQGNDGV